MTAIDDGCVPHTCAELTSLAGSASNVLGATIELLDAIGVCGPSTWAIVEAHRMCATFVDLHPVMELGMLTEALGVHAQALRRHAEMEGPA